MDRLDEGENYKELMDSFQHLYTKRAPTYDESQFHEDLAFDFANGFLTNPDGISFLHASSRVLDLCCGTGLVTYQFVAKMMSDNSSAASNEPGLVVGVDITPALIDQARSKITILTEYEQQRKKPPTMEFYNGDVTKLCKQIPQWEKGSFDLVCICSALVLLNFESIPQAIADWTSYLKPGGKLLFDIPGPGSQPFSNGNVMASIFGKRDMNDAVARYRTEGAPGGEKWSKLSNDWMNKWNSEVIIRGAVEVANELLRHQITIDPNASAPVLAIDKLFVTDKVV